MASCCNDHRRPQPRSVGAGGKRNRVPRESAAGPRRSHPTRKRLSRGYDAKQGSWGSDQKYLDVDSVELAIDRAAHGDARAASMAKQTLDAQLQLLDPVWGGVYQYSTDGVWTKPHFEKIMSVQAENLRIYAGSLRAIPRPEISAAAQAIQRFLATLLTSPDGAFYTSQDADVVEGQHSAEYFALTDQERRKPA